MRLRASFLRAAFALGVALCALASAPAPAEAAAYLSQGDRAALTQGIAAGERKDWGTLRELAYRAQDPTVRAILQWRYLLDRDSGATFAEIAGFIESRPNWPSPKTLQRNAELAIPEGTSDADILAFFANREPESGEGKILFGVALYNSGRTDEGAVWIRRGYIEGGFSGGREAAIRQTYAGIIGADEDRRRLSSLIWEGNYGDATRVMGFVGPGDRAVAEARMKLRAGTRGAERFVERVPQALRSDFGLNFDLGRFYRQREQGQAAARYMAAAIRDPMVELPLDKWWDEKSSHVRLAIKERRWQDAYAVAASNGLDEGADFAEGEFLAGWIALRFLNDPARALGHFSRISPKVFTPISFARGDYWVGRAKEALGDNAGAIVAYQKAASHIETYYGQLAAIRIQTNPVISVDMTRSAPADRMSPVDGDELLKAIEILIAAGDGVLVNRFVAALGDGLSSREDYERAANLLWTLNRPSQSVRVAKRGMQKNHDIFIYAYPMPQLPRYIGTGVEPEAAFTLALMRQESEFDPNAVSRADARGIMQLLPSTARMTANKHRIPWDQSRLLGDWEYNSQLGRAHLQDLIEDFGGSYVMVAAAYNAGPGRVSQWVAEFGDPRGANVDVVDWIERIPFSETRNYVMRLTENTNVYRAMLAGGSAPLMIGQDITRGSGREGYAPQPRPGF